jgi:hypothetical protein
MHSQNIRARSNHSFTIKSIYHGKSNPTSPRNDSTITARNQKDEIIAGEILEMRSTQHRAAKSKETFVIHVQAAGNLSG